VGRADTESRWAVQDSWEGPLLVRLQGFMLSRATGVIIRGAADIVAVTRDAEMKLPGESPERLSARIPASSPQSWMSSAPTHATTRRRVMYGG